MRFRDAIYAILYLPLLVLVAGLLGATLIRFAPGFGADDRDFDPRWSESSRAEVTRQRAADSDIVGFYVRYLGAAIHGDLGTSRSLARPVTELLGERFPVTLRLAGSGLLLAWFVAAGLSLIAVARPGSWADGAAGTTGALFLSTPSALIGIAFLHLNAWLPLAVGFVLFPRIYAYLRNTLVKVSQMPHVLAARARGSAPASLLLRHVLPVALPELLSLAGISVGLALGAAVPIEVLCDQPGIGQLAWMAALGRDLPVLVGLTWVMAIITLAANTFGGSVRLARRGAA